MHCTTCISQQECRGHYKIKQYGLLLEMGERWNYDNCYYDVQIIVCNVDWFLPV